MQELRSAAQESAEDVFFGQVVINWARWFLIAAGIVVVLLTGDDPKDLVIGIIPVVALMAVNFFLHGRYMMEKPANRALITVTSLIDLAIITTVVLVWSEQRGLDSQFFVLYYPMVLAFSFVMLAKVSTAYTVVALVAYAVASFVVESFVVGSVVTESDVKLLIIRLITLGAMGGLGTYFWRIQRNRRRAAAVGSGGMQDSAVGL